MNQSIEDRLLGCDLSVALTVNEINQVLSILGKYPFEEVSYIINKIRSNCQPQVDNLRIKFQNELDAQAAKESSTPKKVED